MNRHCIVVVVVLLASSAFAADQVLVEAESDATTTIQLPNPGKYHLFVRTKDWVAKWDAPGAPGKFQLVINGVALDHTFGTQGKDWIWEQVSLIRATTMASGSGREASIRIR